MLAKTENVSDNFEVELYGNVRDITNDYTSYTRYENILRSELKLVRFFLRTILLPHFTGKFDTDRESALENEQSVNPTNGQLDSTMVFNFVCDQKNND